jgi:hypothetical protein
VPTRRALRQFEVCDQHAEVTVRREELAGRPVRDFRRPIVPRPPAVHYNQRYEYRAMNDGGAPHGEGRGETWARHVRHEYFGSETDARQESVAMERQMTKQAII